MKRTLLAVVLLAGMPLTGITSVYADDAGEPASQENFMTTAPIATKCTGEYRMVSGTITYAGVASDGSDCFSPECFAELKRNPPKSKLQVVIDHASIDAEVSEKKILAFTPFENRFELQEKPKYMETGKSYSFCARPGRQYDTEVVFQIDDLSTIRELKN